MLPTISIGPLVLPTAGLVFIVGIWLTLSVVEHSAAGLRLSVSPVYNLAVTGLAAGMLAARAAFVLQHWPAYRQNLIGIVWPLTSGFNLWAGLLVGAAAAFFYGRAKRLPPGDTVDALAPGLLVALMTVSLADFLAGPGYGTEANLLWSIDLFGISRHPVQLYELLIGAMALAVWRANRPHRHFPGQLFLLSVAIYSAGRLFVDAFRANAWLTQDGYHVVQLISLFALLASLFLLRRSTSPGAVP